jgi:Flp pilus assembly protein TadB
VIALLALAGGAVAALPLVHLARREVVMLRVRPLAAGASPRHAFSIRLVRDLRGSRLTATILRVASVPRTRRAERRRAERLERELPVVVELVGVAVSAGCTPFHAVEHAAQFGPERCAAALRGVMQACARGQSFHDALRDLGVSATTLRPLTDALRTSARLGTPAAPALGRLAAEVRADVRRRAEARARTVPVRLCFPLVLCVLPAFALLTVVPAVLSGLHP